MRTELSNQDVHIHLRRNSELYMLVPRGMRPPITKGTIGVGPQVRSLTSGINLPHSTDSWGTATLSFVPETESPDGVDVDISRPYGYNGQRLLDHPRRDISVKVAHHLYQELVINGVIVRPYGPRDAMVRIKFGLTAS